MYVSYAPVLLHKGAGHPFEWDGAPPMAAWWPKTHTVELKCP